MGDQMLGSEFPIYRNTGTDEAPTWSEVTCLKDVTVNRPLTKVQMSTRASARHKYKPGYADLEVSATLVHMPSDANYVAIMAAYWAKTSIEIALADGPIATEGTQYQRVTVNVFDLGNPQPLDDETTYDITLAEDPDGTEYDLVTVGAS